jgi:DNA polymerase V
MGNDYLDLVSTKKIAILDCNNFYCSCERLFQPEFEKTPTAVLSNNDGCIIARSQEVKDLGVKMGQPVFKLDKNIKNGIKKFSSNYALYGDISDRIVNVLKREIPEMEIYSIDESFLDLSHIPTSQLEEEMTRLKKLIYKVVGIPVSIGVGPNKTLAKLCNYISKNDPSYSGVCSYWDLSDEVVNSIDIGEVWGIGRKFEKKLKSLDIQTVGDFKNLSPITTRRLMHTPGIRTQMELHEVLCYPLETKFKKPKIITTSRTFGSTVWEPKQVQNAIWSFTQNCHRKLKLEKLNVSGVSIFVTTNRFDDNYFVWSTQFKLSQQTNDLQSIWNQISPIIEEMPVRLYYKAGVTFWGLKPEDKKQVVIFEENHQFCEIPYVEHVKWETRREFLSNQWTTSWKDIPKIS